MKATGVTHIENRRHSAQDYRPPAPDAVLAASSAQGLSMPHNLWYDYWGQVKVTDRLACR